MAESPLSDTLDDLLNNEDEDTNSDDNDESNEPTSPIAKIISTNGLKIKIKKRKHDPSSDNQKRKKKKKSKNQPTYMRRNIRTLLTNDKLQDDTLTALKAEQDRLKRLEEINHHQFQPIYTHLPTNFNQISTLSKSNEEECIVLDDDEEETKISLSKPKIDLEENLSIKEPPDNNEDSNDSDVQYVDNDIEPVNDKLTQKLQRLHLDDRVNVPDENGKLILITKFIHFFFRYFCRQYSG
jgi:hypothetical protein